MHLSFVADEPEPEPAPEAPGGEAETVPAALIAGLRDAARLYQATRLKALLGELEGLGPEHAALARRLKGFADVYDMPAIARAIDVETVPG
jgi:hypothetical protein